MTIEDTKIKLLTTLRLAIFAAIPDENRAFDLYEKAKAEVEAYGDERERRGWRKCALKIEDIAAEFGDDAPSIIGEYIGEGLHNTRTSQAEDTNKCCWLPNTR